MLDKTPLRVWSTVWETSFSKIRTRRSFRPPKPVVWVGVFHRDHQTLILSKTMFAHFAALFNTRDIFFVAQIYFVYKHHLHSFNLE